MPGDVREECKTLGDAETPEVLCRAVYAEPCDVETGPCKPAAAEPEWPDPKRRPVPWLIHPDNYRTELDCAWDDVRKAKADYGAADMAYKAKPDDYTAATAELDALRKKLEEDIRTCLKNVTADDHCCTPEEKKPANEPAKKPDDATQANNPANQTTSS
jgi:hypothetical protein